MCAKFLMKPVDVSPVPSFHLLAPRPRQNELSTCAHSVQDTCDAYSAHSRPQMRCRDPGLGAAQMRGNPWVSAAPRPRQRRRSRAREFGGSPHLGSAESPGFRQVVADVEQ